MSLTALTGVGAGMNAALLQLALEKRPSLIVDCGNSADPHSLFPYVSEEALCDVFVMNAEAIYRFRDSLKQVPLWAHKLNAQAIIITTIHTLFSYDDEQENHDVLEHCWELMALIAQRYPVYVGVSQGTIHETFARQFCADMRRQPWDIP